MKKLSNEINDHKMQLAQLKNQLLKLKGEENTIDYQIALGEWKRINNTDLPEMLAQLPKMQGQLEELIKQLTIVQQKSLEETKKMTPLSGGL